jgi:hypothetical protein
MTSPTTSSSRGGSTSSFHCATDDSGVSSNGGSSTLATKPKSSVSRRDRARASMTTTSRHHSPGRQSSCSSSAIGLNTSMSASVASESSLATSVDTMTNGDNLTLCASSSTGTVTGWSSSPFGDRVCETDRLLTGRPGEVGILNHHNTCFINAVVQCLGHTAPLVANLLAGVTSSSRTAARSATVSTSRVISPTPLTTTDSGDESCPSRGGRRARRRMKSESESDHNRSDGSEVTLVKAGFDMRRTNGMRLSDMTESLTELISCLWTGRYSTAVSRTFNETVRQLAADWYNATEQHDAHEFLVWLLDRLNDEMKVMQFD